MTVIITELYDALKAAGAPDDQAKAAAQALARHESRFDRVDGELLELEARLTILQWMVGGVGFGVLLLVLRKFWN